LLTMLSLDAIPARCKPESISSEDEAKAWLVALHDSRLAFHCEDDAFEVGNAVNRTFVRLFADDAAEKMNSLMEQASRYVDACEFLLDLEMD